MAASYPASVHSFTTKSAGNTIVASFFNDPQDEISAIETGLLNGFQHHTFPNVTNTYDVGKDAVRWRNLFLSGGIDASGLGLHLFSASGTGPHALRVRNSSAGTGNKAAVEVGNDTLSTLLQIEALSSTFTTSGPRLAGGVAWVDNSTVGTSFYSGGPIRLYASATLMATALASALRLETNPGVIQAYNSAGSVYRAFQIDALSFAFLASSVSKTTIDASGNLATAGSFTATLQPHCRVYKSANVTFSSGSSYASILFSTEAEDVGGVHDTGSNTSRMTAPSTGVYIVGGTVVWAGNATGSRGAQLFYNNTTQLVSTDQQASNTDALSCPIVWVGGLAANDYVELRAKQNSGGDLDVIGGATFTQAFMAKIA